MDKIPPEYIQSGQATIKYYKSGHKGLLSVNDQENYLENTTYTGDYIQRDNYDPNGEPKGIRYKLTEQAIRNKLIDEMDQQTQNDYQDEPCDYKTEFQDRYNIPGFRHEPPKPSTVKLYQFYLKKKKLFLSIF